MITKADLIAARSRIEDPRHWTTYAFGRDENGVSLQVNRDGFAVLPSCYCLIGAVLPQTPPAPLWEKLYQISTALGKTASELTALNDTGTHESVLAFLDTCIERAS